jgi:hypothetical protein
MIKWQQEEKFFKGKSAVREYWKKALGKIS